MSQILDHEALDEEIRTLRTHYWSARDPDGRAFAPLAEAYRRKGELEEAGALVRDGLDRLPGYATGHLIAARVCRDRGAAIEAREHLDRVLELDPENVIALLERAELVRAEGDREQALEDLQTLLELEPGHPAAFAALEEIEETAVWRPDQEVVFELPESETASGAEDLEEVLEDFDLEIEEEVEVEADEEAEEEDPEEESTADRSMYTRTMGEIYARQGLVERAVEIYSDLLEGAPDDEDLALRLEELRARLGSGGRARSSSGEPVSPPAEQPSAERASVERARSEKADTEPSSDGPVARTRSIGDYFDDLLAWVPGAVPVESLAPEAVPIGSLAPDAVPVDELAPEPVDVESLAPEASAAGLAGPPTEGTGRAPEDAPGKPEDAPGTREATAATADTAAQKPDGGAEQSDEDEDEDGDDDFDEFQSWLESLRT